MADKLMIYEVEYEGEIYELEAPDGASEDDLYAAVQGYKAPAATQVPAAPVNAPSVPPSAPQVAPNAAPAPQQTLAPNAMLGANAEQSVETVAEEEVPEARDFLRTKFFEGKQFGEAQREFNARFGRDATLPDSAAGAWAERQALMDTPAGRQWLQNNDPIDPVNRITGLNDVNTPDSALEEFGVSAQRSLANMANTVTGAAGLVSDLVGADETAQALADEYLEKQAAIGMNYPTSAGQAVDIRSFDDFGRWAASTLGELAPQLTSSLGAGAVGGLVGRKLVERKAADFIEQQVANGVAREVAEAEVAKQVQKATVRGGLVGAGAMSEVQSVGSVYGDTYAKTGELSPWTSLLAGTAVASLDTILPARILSKVGGPVANDIIADGLVKRLGKEGAASFLLEGGTEALQTVIEQLPSGEVNWDEVLEAGLRGGFGGGVAGTAVAGYEAARQQKALPATVVPEPTGVPEGSSPIAVPDATNRRTKAYRTQVADTAEQVSGRINELVSEWENAPTFEVHQNFNGLKGVARNAVGALGPDGKVIINTENLIKQAKATGRTVDQMVSALTYHEALGHHGLTQLFGDTLDTKLSEMLENSPVYKARVDKWLAKNKDAYAGDRNRDLRAFEELLAEGSEKGQLPVSFVNQMKNWIKDFGRTRLGLEMEYSTREVETILGMAHSAVVNGKGRDARANGFRYMYVGQNAKTADLSALSTAQLRLRQGDNPEDVRVSTGWFKADDGRWRFELDDSKAGFKYFNNDLLDTLVIGTQYEDYAPFMRPFDDSIRTVDALADPSLREELSTEGLYLSEVYDHPELYAAYPELRNAQVSRESMTHLYPEESKNLAGGWDNETQTLFVSPDLDEDELRKTIIHEIQHAVQDIEGFARGGNNESATALMTDSNVIETTNNFLNWAESRPEWESKVPQIEQILNAGQYDLLRRWFGNERAIGKEAYQHLFGEVEARDTESRLDLTAAERENTQPYSSENLDPARYIFDMDGEGVGHKYMMLTAPDKVEFTPEEIASMTPEELFESENAYTVLQRMTEGYTPVVIPLDDLRREAELRGFSPNEILKHKGADPGDLAKKLYMYDIAANKLQDRITTLYDKMQNGQRTAANMAAHAKAMYTMQEITQKIFDVQGEIGRSLAAMKTVNFTRRRVGNTMEMVAQFQKNSPFEYLNDPDEYMKFAMSIQQQIVDGKEKMKASGMEFAANALNLPRAIMSTLDLSAPLRQGIFLIHKKAWWKSFFNMFRYWTNEQAYKDLRENIMSRNTYSLMLDSKLALSDIDGKLNSREEDFQTEWAQKIPGFGIAVRMSERAYGGFLNKLRADVFDDMVAQLGDNYTLDDVKDISRFINAASGRGNLHTALQSSAPVFNALFFSPRLIASRLTMTTDLIRPRTYTKMNKVARKEYLKSIFTVGSTALMVLWLATMGGADVEKDPRSSDFAKIKVGNTRFDILGGEGQYITLASRIAKDSYKTADGNIRPYGRGFGKTSQRDAIDKFVSNKFSPIASFVNNYFAGENAIGEKFEWDREIAQRFVPMFAMDLYENVKEEGAAKGTAMTAPAMFGVGVQNYKSYSQDPEREIEVEPTFDMKSAKDGEYNNATVEDGVVKLDEEAQKEWATRLNTYIREWMKEEMAKPEWKTMTLEERRNAIKAVRDDARKETKLDMLELLQIEETE